MTQYYTKRGRKYVPAASYEFPVSPADGLFFVRWQPAGVKGWSQVLRLSEIPLNLDARSFAACVGTRDKMFPVVRDLRAKGASDNDLVNGIMKVLADACTVENVEKKA